SVTYEIPTLRQKLADGAALDRFRDQLYQVGSRLYESQSAQAQGYRLHYLASASFIELSRRSQRARPEEMDAFRILLRGRNRPLLLGTYGFSFWREAPRLSDRRSAASISRVL